jgi:hypothetical protein
MSKRTKVWVLAACFFIIVPGALIFLFGFNIVNLVAVVSIIGLGIPIIAQMENDLIADGKIKLENGGSKTGNFLARCLVVLIFVVAALLFASNWVIST